MSKIQLFQKLVYYEDLECFGQLTDNMLEQSKINYLSQQYLFQNFKLFIVAIQMLSHIANKTNATWFRSTLNKGLIHKVKINKPSIEQAGKRSYCSWINKEDDILKVKQMEKIK